MSTRAQVKIIDSYKQELWFYRHSDGYPEGTMPSLEKFLGWVKAGQIRDNVGQAAGWLVLIGAEEYGTVYDYAAKETRAKKTLTAPTDNEVGMGWKCGAYEPCVCELRGYVEYFYTVDLAKKTIEVKKI